MNPTIDAFTMQDRQALHDFLIGLPLTTGEAEPRTAICSSVRHWAEVRAPGDLAGKLFHSLYNEEVLGGWEHYSGSPDYPVPPTKKNKSSDAAYWAFEEAVLRGKSFWSVRSQYGRLRRDLARYLAEAALTWGIES